MNKNSTDKIKNRCRFDESINSRSDAGSNNKKSNNEDLINALKTAVKEYKENYKEGEFLNAFVASSDGLVGDAPSDSLEGVHNDDTFDGSRNGDSLNNLRNTNVFDNGRLNNNSPSGLHAKSLDDLHNGKSPDSLYNAKSLDGSRNDGINTSNESDRKIKNPVFDSVFETDEDFENAKERALSLLDKTIKTSKELFYFLCDKGYSKDTAGKTVDYIVRLGLINDKEICDSLIRNYFFTKHYSKRVIREKLYNKKIPSEIISESLDNIDEEQEAEVLGAVIKKKAETIKRLESDNPDSKSKYRKLINYALQKGFSYSQIKRVMSSPENETLFES